MSAISQFFSGSGGGGGAGTNTTGGKSNRLIFIGPVSRTWTAPAAATEVEVHCWGGGGYGSANSSTAGSAPRGGGGGGGGYVRHLYPNSLGTITLSITVGGLAGTSSVTCPTQSPTSPISATGGSTATTNAGAAGGSGSFTIAPGISAYYTFAASGGAGGIASGPGVAPPSPAVSSPLSVGGGGGAGGSPYGTGGDGASMTGQPSPGPGGAGGGWGPAAMGILNVGGVALKGSIPSLGTVPNASIMYNIDPTATADTGWFSVEDIATTLLDSGAMGSSPSKFGGGAGGHPGNGSGIQSLIAGGGGGAAGVVGLTYQGGNGGRGCVIIYW